MTSDLDLVGERNENYVNLVTQRAGIATGSAERLPVIRVPASRDSARRPRSKAKITASFAACLPLRSVCHSFRATGRLQSEGGSTTHQTKTDQN